MQINKTYNINYFKLTTNVTIVGTSSTIQANQISVTILRETVNVKVIDMIGFYALVGSSETSIN